jgi:hypothetical protein
MVTAMEVAKKLAREKRYRGVWDEQLEQFRAVPPERWHYTLIEPLLLREVLKNIFTNVRYSLRGVSKPDRGFAQLIELGVTLAEQPPAADEVSEERRVLVVLRLVSKGNKYTPGGGRPAGETTLDQHRRGVAKYGGELSVEPYIGRNRVGTAVELRLISRGDYRPVS